MNCLSLLVFIFCSVIAKPQYQLSDLEQGDQSISKPSILSVDKTVNDDKLPTNIEEDRNYWDEGQQMLKQQLEKKINTNTAKNIIFFLGDGMSVPTLFASRVYKSQLEKNIEMGEDGQLFWETFPYTGLVKPSCVDTQVADSACTSTAYLGGVRTKYGTIGLNEKAIRGDCKTQKNKKNHVDSILKKGQLKGKSAGFVTTTSVTDASPAGSYAHVADRKWESDTQMFNRKADPSECLDIASQLILEEPGKDFKVILGGGRKFFLPVKVKDDEGHFGDRSDGKDLIDIWKRDKMNRNAPYLYSTNGSSLREVIQNPENYDYLLGLYDPYHIPYHLENVSDDPTLAEMTEAAIKLLQKNLNGFILFIEGGRIDHAHHETFATIALDETVEMAKAVEKAEEMTSDDDTLIIVTSDHSHTMTVSGYSPRGTKINGINSVMPTDNIPFTTLSYANGPGYKQPTENLRYNISHDDIDDPMYRFPSLIPLRRETHGGEDVAVFARGPWSHLFTGTINQHSIPYLLAHAAKIDH